MELSVSAWSITKQKKNIHCMWINRIKMQKEQETFNKDKT